MTAENSNVPPEPNPRRIVVNDHPVTADWLMAQVELAKAGQIELCLIPAKSFSAFTLLFHAQQLLNARIEDEEVFVGYRYAAICLQAATVECAVNDALIQHAHEHYGDQAKQIAESLLSGSLPAKIRRVVPVLSHGTKYLDCSQRTVRLIFELLKVRNGLAHPVEHYKDQNAIRKARKDFLQNGVRPFADDVQKKKDSVSLERCKEYEAAVSEFATAIWNGPIERPTWNSPLIKDGTPEADDEEDDDA